MLEEASFASMAQDEFAIVYDKMIEVILTKILPFSSKVDLERQVHEILDGYVR